MEQKTEFRERYERNAPALNTKQTAILGAKKVCVIGCGGIGGYVIETLVRLGVGTIIAVDGDIFEASNLNRQLLSLESNMGNNKANEAVKRAALINSGVLVTAITEQFTESNASAILNGCALAVDALDNTESRCILSQFCAKADIPLIHGAISGWSLQASVVFSTDKTFEKLYGNRTNSDEGNDAGSLPFTAMAAAALECALAVQVLLGEKKIPLSNGTILSADLRDCNFTKFSLQTDP